MALASECGWEVVEKGQRATFLLVQLRQRSYVLPWSLFLFAEGTDTEMRALFHTHFVLMQGAGLMTLLEDVARQSVCAVVEPDRTAKFSKTNGPQITTLSVTENK